MNKFSIVSGVSKSHLLRTMKLVDDRKMLRIGVTSYIPSNSWFIKFAPPKIRNKFYSRSEDIHGLNTTSNLVAEIVYQVGRWLDRHKFHTISDKVVACSFLMFSYFANSCIDRIPDTKSEILLVRAGFGCRIRKGNRIFICDASLAHPSTLPTLLVNGELGITDIKFLSSVDRLILRDIEYADRILVNSDFVKDSFVFAGVNESKITVAYLPPLPHFLKITKTSRVFDGTIKLLFAGGLEERKGINILHKLVEQLCLSNVNFQLLLIGNWGRVEPEVRESLLKNPKVKHRTWVSQTELAEEMSRADIFIFPSYAEGGARVVTEAMARGKAVITSHNSGSPITHGFDGIISKLDADELMSWIHQIIGNPSLRHSLESNARITAQTRTSDYNYCQILEKLSVVGTN
jgi:glycosyltransferase involved in cell wall biosynthesis